MRQRQSLHCWSQIVLAAMAAVVAWLVLTLPDRRWLVAGVLGIAIITTARRSALYANPERLWRDAIAKVPANPRAYDNLAAVVLHSDSARRGEAEGILRQAIAIDSDLRSRLDQSRRDRNGARSVRRRAHPSRTRASDQSGRRRRDRTARRRAPQARRSAARYSAPREGRRVLSDR